MAEADALADRVAIIDHGRLLALDTPAGLKRSVRGGPPTLETVFIQLTGKELRDS
jgi:ABC-2 type transport system ATP-binding protein